MEDEITPEVWISLGEGGECRVGVNVNNQEKMLDAWRESECTNIQRQRYKIYNLSLKANDGENRELHLIFIDLEKTYTSAERRSVKMYERKSIRKVCMTSKRYV